jgi:hypothetical protein
VLKTEHFPKILGNIGNIRARLSLTYSPEAPEYDIGKPEEFHCDPLGKFQDLFFHNPSHFTDHSQLRISFDTT